MKSGFGYLPLLFTILIHLIYHPDSYLNLLCSTGNALNCGAAVEILQASSRVSLLHHSLSSAMTHTQTHMKPDRRAHAHIKHTKKWQSNTGDRQLASYTLAGGLQTHRSDHSHTPCSANLCHTALPVQSSQWQREKKNEEKKKKNTLLTLVLGCHLTYTECISNSWVPCVSLFHFEIARTPRQPFQVAESLHSRAKSSRDELSKHSRTRAVESLELSDPAETGVPDSCQPGKVRFWFSHQKVAEPNKKLWGKFSSVTNHNYVNDTTVFLFHHISLTNAFPPYP